MKILLANKFFFHNGGSETVFFQERAFLLEQGHQVVDFSMSDSRNLPSPHADDFVGARTYKGPSTALEKAGAALSLIHSREAVARIEALIRREGPDLLHCHNIYHQLTPSIMRAAHRAGVPVVLTLHDYKPICPVYTRLESGTPCDRCGTGHFSHLLRHRCAEGSLARSALLYAEAMFHDWRGSYACVDRVIAPSFYLASAVSRWRFAPERVSVLRNGVDPAQFTPGAKPGDYFLFIGRLSPEKGLETLGRAQAGTGLRVRVAGTGPMEPFLRRAYPGLELLGHRGGAELRELIAGAAAIVVPSEWHENCPMSVIEAMAAGKPVIASRIGGIPELVGHQRTGLLFQAGRDDELRIRMMELRSQPETRMALGWEGRRRVEADLSLQAHNDGLLRIYEATLGLSPGSMARKPRSNAARAETVSPP